MKVPFTELIKSFTIVCILLRVFSIPTGTNYIITCSIWITALVLDLIIYIKGKIRR